MSGPVRVLVLDDDERVRRVWAKMAWAMGVDLRAVASEREARAWLEAESFDAVLCDVRLGRNETNVAFVRELAQARSPLVAVVSGEPSAAIEALGLRVPVFGRPLALDAVLSELGLWG
ncbi:MAG: response regulator [Sandaracinaceae bacterium]|nr:response regulator [Sandaracinaceae bacterium]